jgi:hypothetical protein
VSLGPNGFAGATSSFTFVAVRSGQFNDPSVWSNGIVPYGEFSLTIPVGIRVTLARSTFELRMKACEIFGSLALGSGSSTFRFDYPPNLIVRANATLEDLTSRQQLLFPLGSLVTLHPNSLLRNQQTLAQTYSRTDSVIQLGKTKTLPLSGPFTFSTLPTGELVSFNKITYIAIQSGNFTSASTYLGGTAPTASLCQLVGSCGIVVPADVVLSTDDLQDELNINVDTIDIISGGVVRLGTTKSTRGFRFRYPVALNVLGQLSLISSEGSIYIPRSSSMNFFTGGIFHSVSPTSVQVFDPLSDFNFGSASSLGVSLTGPLFFTVAANGVISIDVLGESTHRCEHARMCLCLVSRCQCLGKANQRECSPGC